MEGNPDAFRPEQEGERLFDAYQTAEGNVESILNEMSEILATAEDREKAEHNLLNTHADRLDQAMQTARELLNRWLRYVRERGREE